MRKKSEQKQTYYDLHIWPAVAPTMIEEDQGANAKADFRREWKRLEKIPGIRTLIKKGDHKSVLAIFDACINL